MPHKRTPAAAVLARAGARLAHANAGLLLGGEYEHERAAGAWQAEWPALSAGPAFPGGAAAAGRRPSRGLASTGGAAAAARRSLEGLQVDAEQMGENVAGDETGAAEALVDRALGHYPGQEGPATHHAPRARD